ncbi:MAG: hypothetical protein K0R05_2549 [Anaerocolumna sp.]|nr:hypothetical protein [Anaerocolumna sp.]
MSSVDSIYDLTFWKKNRCKAQYEAFVNNDSKEALRLINLVCDEFPNNFRVLIDKFYISQNLRKLRKT